MFFYTKALEKGLLLAFSFFVVTLPAYADVVNYPPDTIDDPLSLSPVAVGPDPAAVMSDNTVTVTLSGGDSTINYSVYGGYITNPGSSEDIENNTVTVQGEGTIGESVYGGYTLGSGTVSNNMVTVSDQVTIVQDVYGGYTLGSGTVSNNIVTVSDQVTIGQDVYGGFNTDGATTGNSVTITNADISDEVYGGYSSTGYSTDNTVTISGSTVGGTIYGGAGYAEPNTGNIVTITDSEISGDVYGGYGQDSSSAGNAVTITNCSLNNSLIVGGEGGNGSSTGNTVTVSDSSGGSTIYGGYGTSSATDNRVEVNQVEFSSIYGGLADSDIGANNTVIITDSFVQDVYGGYSPANVATSNTVTITNGIISLVYGGYSQSSLSESNSVTIDNSEVGFQICGGYSQLGSTTSNTLAITSSTINAQVFGGFCDATGSVTGNTVTISESVLNHEINGGRSLNGFATNNTVMISLSTIDAEVCGGISQSESSSGNSVIINECITSSQVSGGYSQTSSATNNTVTINNSTLDYVGLGGIFGGRCDDSGSATGNTITINESLVNSELYGGFSQLGAATGNTVIINGGMLNADIYGGGSFTGLTTDNTVTINGAPNLDVAISIYGGSNAFTGNILNWGTTTLATIMGVHNFQNYNFFLPSILTNGQTLITTTNPTDLAGSTVTITGIQSGGASLQQGDLLTLISSTDNAPDTFNGTDVAKGLTEKYDFVLEPSPTSLQIRVAAVHQLAKEEIQTKALSEGWIAGLASINRGADLIENQALDNALIAVSRGSGLTVFGATGGSVQRYNTGSHVDANGFSMLMGVAYQGELPCCAPLLLGGFFESGVGDYNSFNSFSTSAVNGNGDTSYTGGGFLVHYQPCDSLYFEASGRAGQAKTDFNTREFTGFTGVNVGYSARTPYYGAHAGVGSLFCWKEDLSVDLSTKFLWTRQAGDSFTVVGDPVHFQDSNSLRWRSKARLLYELGVSCSPFVGAAYEYEFDGKVKATVNNTPVDQPSLRGGTGIGEIGLICRPWGGSSLFVELNLQGLVGKRVGVNGSLQVKYLF